jgi:hypothetical protein
MLECPWPLQQITVAAILYNILTNKNRIIGYKRYRYGKVGKESMKKKSQVWNNFAVDTLIGFSFLIQNSGIEYRYTLNNTGGTDSESGSV